MLSKMMNHIKVSINIPLWYILLVAVVLTALILYGITYPSFQYTRGIFLDPSLYGNPNVLGKIQPNRTYTDAWNELDIVSAFFCLFMGFVCSILGIARSANGLGGRQINMLALFLGLFAVNTLSLTKFVTAYFDPVIIFYVYWFTYFTYPIALFIHLYSYLDKDVKKWIWPALAIPITYAASVLMVHAVYGFPYEIFGKPYTPITVACMITIILVGFVKVKHKPMFNFIRAISVFWFFWTGYTFIKIWLIPKGYLHNEYKNGITITAIFIVCFFIVTSVRELFSYKNELQVLSLQNRLALESYEQIKTYNRQISSIKHEVTNHLTAMQILINNNRNADAAEYLNRYTEQVNAINEAVYHENIFINAVIGTLMYKAKEFNIQVELDLNASPLHIIDIDLYSLFSNVINNAIEACRLMPDNMNRLIKLAISKKEPYINFDCSNSMLGEIIRVNGQFKTTKHESGHGYGLHIINRIAHNYDGIVVIDCSESMFNIMISLKDEKLDGERYIPSGLMRG